MTGLLLAATTLPEISTVLGIALAPLAVLLVGFYKFARDQMREARLERSEQLKVYRDALDSLGLKLEDLGTKIERDSRTSAELLTFMQRLNGRLPKAVDERIKQASRR